MEWSSQRITALRERMLRAHGESLALAEQYWAREGRRLITMRREAGARPAAPERPLDGGRLAGPPAVLTRGRRLPLRLQDIAAGPRLLPNIPVSRDIGPGNEASGRQ